MGVNHQQFNLVSTDGTILRGRFWKPDTSPVATICLIHGIGEHSGRYDAWARRFCRQGIMVYAMDYRGHGESEGQRGHAGHIGELLDDIGALVRRCKRNFGDIPGFIYGHSMGGNLALIFLMRRRQDFAGAIITSPWLELVKPPRPFLRKVGLWMDGFFPDLSLSTGLKSNQMSSLPKRIEEADNDPLMHSKITLRMFNEIDKSAAEVISFRIPVRIPLFLLHGEKDQITKPEATEAFYKNNPELFKLKLYPGALHELHNEPAADEVFQDILGFIQTQISRFPAPTHG